MLAVIRMLSIRAWNHVVRLSIIERTLLYILNSKQDTIKKPKQLLERYHIDLAILAALNWAKKHLMPYIL